MSALPDHFRAFVANRLEATEELGIRDFSADDLPAGEVTIRVEWSSVNYKDGLAAKWDGRVARINPIIPGIDLAGTVVDSSNPSFAVGAKVLSHGYDLGVSRHGGYAEYQRVPGAWCVSLPETLACRDAMAIGTAGFTAAMGVTALEARGLVAGSGPVLVTGASGGLGSIAVDILAGLGHDVWAMTRKPDQHERLRFLGAAGFLNFEDLAAEAKPLESERWAGAIDAVGGPTLPYVLRTLRRGAAVAAAGNAGGPLLLTTVLPFILRGVALMGMDSVMMPIVERRALWTRLATDLRPRHLDDCVREVDLEHLEHALDGVVAGLARGRWLVRVGGRNR